MAAQLYHSCRLGPADSPQELIDRYVADPGVTHDLSSAYPVVGHVLDHFAANFGKVSHLRLHGTKLSPVIDLCQPVPNVCVETVQL